MKKIYLQPEIAVVKIELTTIVAGSIVFDRNVDNKLGDGQILTKDQNDWNSSSHAKRRRRRANNK